MADTAFDEALTVVNELLAKLQDAWNDIVHGVNHVLSIVPAFLEAPIRFKFDKCSLKVTEAYNEVFKVVSELGSANALRTAGESWNEQVGRRASMQVKRLAKEALETNDWWTDTAAFRYGEAVILQGKALTQIKTITDSVQTTLTEIASALNVLVWGCAGALAAYVAALVGCFIGVFTGVGLPASLQIAFVASVACLGIVFKLTVDFDNTLDEKRVKFEQRTTDWLLAVDNWPSAVADSFTNKVDDDDDWTPK